MTGPRHYHVVRQNFVSPSLPTITQFTFKMTQLITSTLESMGTAATLAAAGVWLHRRGHISSTTKTTLSRFSQQVSTPALFFTKLVKCSQGGGHCGSAIVEPSTTTCPSVMNHISTAWILLIWPIVVVSCGLTVGRILSLLLSVHQGQRGCILAACAFANSAALPITLLAAMRETQDHDMIDPNSFLSVYSILYPMIQWSTVPWLVSSVPPDPSTRENEETTETGEQEMSLIHSRQHGDGHDTLGANDSSAEFDTLRRDAFGSHGHKQPERTRCQELVSGILSRGLQPPVVSSIVGIITTSTPWLRSLLVPTTTSAPILQWWFRALQTLAGAAVPVNMTVLGANLSMAAQGEGQSEERPTRLIIGAVLGKLVLMPLAGLLLVTTLRNMFWGKAPSEDLVQTPLTWVLMMEFCTPTATNVMVIVDLMGGEHAKQVMAQIIAWEYVTAPILLSLWIMCILHLS